MFKVVYNKVIVTFLFFTYSTSVFSGPCLSTSRNIDEHFREIVEDIASRQDTGSPTMSLSNLLKSSNANEHSILDWYIDADNIELNKALRNRDVLDYQQEAVINELEHLNEYEGVSYRALHVTQSGFERITSGKNLVILDRGIQSASTQPSSIGDWFSFQGNPEGLRKVLFIFDEEMSQYNMSTDFLLDHVVVKPSAPMKITKFFLHDDGILYVKITSPTNINVDIFDPYTGKKVL